MKEVDYYPDIAAKLVSLIKANLSNSESYRITPLIGEINSALNTLKVNNHPMGELLQTYASKVHKLHLDVTILIENIVTGKFELIIFEVKIGKNLGLTQLSQLIGYCLVSKIKFGILLNIDDMVSDQFSIILDADKHLTHIKRIIEDQELVHELGVMTYNSQTKNIEYTQSGAVKTIPDLVAKVKPHLD